MLFRDYLLLLICIGLLCGSLYLHAKAFLGYYGSWVPAVLVVLGCLAFLGDGIAVLISLRNLIFREVERI